MLVYVHQNLHLISISNKLKFCQEMFWKLYFLYIFDFKYDGIMIIPEHCLFYNIEVHFHLSHYCHVFSFFGASMDMLNFFAVLLKVLGFSVNCFHFFVSRFHLCLWYRFSRSLHHKNSLTSTEYKKYFKMGITDWSQFTYHFKKF